MLDQTRNATLTVSRDRPGHTLLWVGIAAGGAVMIVGAGFLLGIGQALAALALNALHITID